MSPEEFDVLVFKHFAAGLTPAEGETLRAALRERPEFRRRFLQESIRVGTIHEWAAEQLAAQPAAARPNSWFRPAMAAAAAAVIVATVAVVMFRKQNAPPPVVVVPAVEPIRPSPPPPVPPARQEPLVRPVPRPIEEPSHPSPQPKPPDPSPEPPKAPVPPPPPPEPKPVPPKEPPRTEVMIAVLEEVRGTAILASEKGEVKAKVELSIPAGATVRTTGLDAVVVLLFPDKTRVALGAETELRVVRSDGGKRLTLVRGVAALDVTPQPKEQPLQVETAHATATVLGTSFTIRADASRLRLEVDEGKVRLENPQGRTAVVAKEQVVEAGAGAELSVKRMAPPDLVTELVGHWKFDETGGNTAQDASPHRHHAALEGTVRVKGKSGLGLRFDGVDDFVRLPRSSMLDALQEGDYTMAAWVQPAEFPRNGRVILMGKVGFHIGLAWEEDRFQMWHYVATGPNGGLAHASSRPGHAAGEFYHLAGVVSPSKGITQIFVNGRLEGIARWTAGTPTRDYGGRGWTIGMAREAGVSYHPANAIIDDVRLYRRALSARDIAVLAGVPLAAASRVRQD